MNQYKRLDRKLIKKGSIIDYYNDIIEVNHEKQVIFDYIDHKGAAAMIPVSSDGKIIMVRQYRNAIDQYSLEIPAGGLNPEKILWLAPLGNVRRRPAIRQKMPIICIDVLPPLLLVTKNLFIIRMICLHQSKI